MLTVPPLGIKNNIGPISGTVAGATFAVLICIIVVVVFKQKKKSNTEKIEGGSISSTPAKFIGKEVSIQSLLKGTILSPTQEEFNHLEALDAKRSNDNTNLQGRKHNKKEILNLHHYILPFDHNRVVLRTYINKSDYINATWVSKASIERYDSLELVPYAPYPKINFIVAQSPMKNTLPHHFQMVHENLTDVIVAINTREENLFGILGQNKTFGNTMVRLRKRYKIHPTVFKSEIEISNKTSDARYCQNVTFFEFNEWPIQLKAGEFSKDEMENFLSFFSLVRQEMILSKDEMTTIVHDADGGVGPAALWVAMYELLQKVDENMSTQNTKQPSSNDDLGKLDVYRVVNDLRKQRSKMINCFENYKLLFKLLQYYCQHKTIFDKIRAENEIPTEYLMSNDSNSNEDEYVLHDPSRYQDTYENI